MTESQITSRFGTTVRSLRHRLGISQETLAERADLHRTYIADVEGGVRNVTLKTMDKLARGLGVSTATLLLQVCEPSGRAELPCGKSSTSDYVDILLVGDNHDEVELTLRACKQAGITYSVQVVRDGREALDFLSCVGRYAQRHAANQPKVIILDLTPPKVNRL